MIVIGLSGGIGSGKSTVADLFAAHGVDVIDADLVARQVVEPGQPALASIADHFGSNILDDNGRLKRSELRAIVFADDDERAWLESLLHPLINARIRHLIEKSRSPYCLLVSPLLLETGQRNLVDRIVIVDVDRETQISRALARDKGTRETIEAIIDAQMSRQTRREAADDIIDNSGPVENLEDAVSSLHRKYLRLASESG